MKNIVVIMALALTLIGTVIHPLRANDENNTELELPPTTTHGSRLLDGAPETPPGVASSKLPVAGSGQGENWQLSTFNLQPAFSP